MSWDLGNRTYTQDPAPTSTTTILMYPRGAAMADDPDFLGSTHVLRLVPNDQTKRTQYLFLLSLAKPGFGMWVLAKIVWVLRKKLLHT